MNENKPKRTLLTVRAAAKEMGVSEWFVRKEIREGRLPKRLRPGAERGMVLFYSDLDDYIETFLKPEENYLLLR